MEIALLSQDSIRIKGKLATCIVNPVASKAKLVADVVLSFTPHETPQANFETEPLFVSGPGEYESKGMKITGVAIGDVVCYQVIVDNVSCLVTKGSVVEKIKDKFDEADILTILADDMVSQSAITALDPYVVIVFGEKATEIVKSLGKEVAPVSKYVTTKDKLPSEMEVVCLA